jgi:5-methylcytosine-specific restriction endonuclease McrA
MNGTFAQRPRASKNTRADRQQGHSVLFQHNRKIILATQSICGICGKPVDKSIKYPDPMSPTVDHIIPLNKGGDPSALENLQLAHRYCNRLKSDKIITEKAEIKDENRKLPLTIDWKSF